MSLFNDVLDDSTSAHTVSLSADENVPILAFSKLSKLTNKLQEKSISDASSMMTADSLLSCELPEDLQLKVYCVSKYIIINIFIYRNSVGRWSRDPRCDVTFDAHDDVTN